MKTCNFCSEPAAYKNVNHCKKCHSIYCKRDYKTKKERMKQWRKSINT